MSLILKLWLFLQVSAAAGLRPVLRQKDSNEKTVAQRPPLFLNYCNGVKLKFWQPILFYFTKDQEIITPLVLHAQTTRQVSLYKAQQELHEIYYLH